MRCVVERGMRGQRVSSESGVRLCLRAVQEFLTSREFSKCFAPQPQTRSPRSTEENGSKHRATNQCCLSIRKTCVIWFFCEAKEDI